MSALSKNTLIYGVGIGMNQLFSILLLPLFTHYLTKEEFGVIGVLNLLVLVLFSIFSLGLNVSGSIVYFSHEGQRERDRAINNTLFVLFAASLCMLIAGGIFSGWMNDLLFQGQNYTWAILTMIAQAAFLNITTPFASKLQYENRPYVFTAITLTGALSFFLFSYIFIVHLGWGVLGFCISSLLSKVVLALMFSIACREVFAAGLDRKECRRLIKLGLPMIPAFFALYVLQQGNTFVLSKTHSMEVAGLYSAGANIGMAVQLLISGFATAWMPFFLKYKTNPEAGKNVLFLVYKYFLLVMSVLTALMFPASGLLSKLFLDTSFQEGEYVIGFIASAYFGMGIFSLLLPPLYFREKVYLSSVIQVIGCVLFVPLSWLLSEWMGITGAAFALFSCSLMINLFVIMIYRLDRNYLQIDYLNNGLMVYFLVFFVVLTLILFRGYFDLGSYPLYFLLLIVSVFGSIILGKQKEIRQLLNE